MSSTDSIASAIYLVHLLLLSRTGDIKVPKGVQLLFPRTIGPRIFALYNENIILKVGPSIEMCEAEAMRFVARETRIPVPKVIKSYIEDRNGYIFISKLEDKPLGDC